ncbi:MAG: hypothetical protein GF329_10115 [Candidatus Lokiarchaeota archaeon]|nr:hypothetical protein [Candidatus Lokiarchaeota archaeon]
MSDDDQKVHERILLLKHCFYYDSMGETDSLKFLNEKLEKNGIKNVNSFQEAAYILTDSELKSILNGISVVNPFKGQFYSFRNKHLYIQQDSSDKILAEVDRAIRIYKEKAWVIVKILTLMEKIDIETLKEITSNVISSTVDYNHILGEFQNNYQILTAIAKDNKVYWKIPDEIKNIVSIQIDHYEKYKHYLDRLIELLEEKQETKKESKKQETKGETFINLTEVLNLIQEDKIPVETDQQPMTQKEKKKVKKKLEKSEIEGKSITVEGRIKKILKNDITFRTADGQEVKFTCKKPEIIAYCIGHIETLLRFYFDVKASELVCQRVETADQ